MDERARIVAETADLFRDISRALHRDKPREWLEMDITMPQLKTLICLYGLGKASMGELAEALGTGVSTVTGIVDRLVDHGLVVREEAPYDRRVVIGRLTPEGTALVDRLHVETRERFVQILNQLTPDELRLVARAAGVLRRAVSRLAAASPAGPRPIR